MATPATVTSPADNSQQPAAPQASPATPQTDPTAQGAQQQLETTTPSVTATVPTEQMQKSPTVLVPEKRGGIGGLVDEIRNALSPQTATQVYRDPDTGQRYVQHPTRTGGQQWARLASEAVTGAAAGYAAGQGAGNQGKAALAGMQAQQKQDAQQKQEQEAHADEDYTLARQNRIDKANAYMQSVKVASAQFELARAKVTAGQEDMKFADDQEDREQKLGSVDLGTYPDHYTLADVKKVHPDFWKDAVNGDVRVIPNYDAKGNPAGVHLFLRQPGIGEQPAPPGTQAYRFVPGATPKDPPRLETFVPTGSHTIRDMDSYNTAALGQMQQWQTGQADLKQKSAQTAAEQAQASVAPSEAAKNYSEAHKDNVEAQAAATSTQADSALAQETPTNGVRKNYLASLPQADQSIVQAIGEGRMQNVSAYSLGRSPEARRIASEVTTAYPNYDFSRADVYKQTREAFTKGKEAQGINALNAAMNHMGVMYDNATWGTTNPVTGAFERWGGNQAAIDEKDAKTALVDELGKAYKAGALTNEDMKTWSGRINTWSPAETKGNAHAFVKLLQGKMAAYQNQWNAGAPPGAVAPIPIMGPEAKSVYNRIVGPQQQQGQQPQQQPQTQQPRTAPAPAGATNEVHQGGPNGPLIGHIVNGKYVAIGGQTQ